MTIRRDNRTAGTAAKHRTLLPLQPNPGLAQQRKVGTNLVRPNVSADLSHLMLAVYQMAQASPIGEFEEQLFLLLHEHIAFDSAWLGKSTMLAPGPQMHNSYLHHLSSDYVADWEKVKAYDPIVPKVIKAPQKAVSMSIAEESLAAQYRTFMSKHAVAQIICGVSVDPLLKLWTHLSLYKNSLVPEFTAEEIELTELAMPHLASALSLNRMQHMQQLKAAKLNLRESFAICDNLGVLHHADASFADLMLLEWPKWRGAMLPPAFGNLQQEKGANLYVGKHISLQMEKVSDLLLINAKPRSAIDALTPRELAVVRLYGEGMTYKAVAKQLAIAPATVRHHLREAYAKLDVKSKGEIAWLLSRDEERIGS
jgi:DNA-binding CsgD family transcriptional regulator